MHERNPLINKMSAARPPLGDPSDTGNARGSAFNVGFKTFTHLQRLFSLENGAQCHAFSRIAGHLAIHLPEVARRLSDDEFGVLHLELGVLKLATRDAINERDWGTVSRHFAFIDMLFQDAPADLDSAIQVSYLGMLLSNETNINFCKARTLLPPLLTSALNAVERHYAACEQRDSAPPAATTTPTPPTELQIVLSERESRILQLLYEGNSVGQMADSLNCMMRTVDLQLRNVARKLGVTSRNGVVIEALRRGMIARS